MASISEGLIVVKWLCYYSSFLIIDCALRLFSRLRTSNWYAFTKYREHSLPLAIEWSGKRNWCTPAKRTLTSEPILRQSAVSLSFQMNIHLSLITMLWSSWRCMNKNEDKLRKLNWPTTSNGCPRHRILGPSVRLTSVSVINHANRINYY